MNNANKRNRKKMKQTQVINVRLTLEEIEQIDTLAKADDRSRAYIIRKLIRLSLDELLNNGSLPHEEGAE